MRGDTSTNSATISAAQLTELLEVTRALVVTTELSALLARIVDAACSMLDCERASIFLHDPKAGQLWTTVAKGSKEIRVPEGAGIVGAAFKSNALVHVPEPYSDPRFNPEPDRLSGFVTRSLLTAPMGDLTGRPIGVLQAVNKKKDAGDHFSGGDLSLITLLADQAGVAIQRYRLQKDAEGMAKMTREMEIARAIQQALIPKSPPCVKGLVCAGYTRPASATGGDAYDLWSFPRGDRLGVFLGDATGHGIGPALIVSQARTLLRALCESHGDIACAVEADAKVDAAAVAAVHAAEEDPHTLICRINSRLASDMTAGNFVTMFVAVIRGETGEIRWTSGGHGPIFLQRSADAPIEQLQPPGPPVGVIEPFLGDPVEPVILERGGRIIVLSDGLPEAMSPTGELLGVTALLETVERTRSASPGATLIALQEVVARWENGRDINDDQTVVIVQRE